MRINTPVTSNERQMKDGSMIVTKTDLKGVITYANKDFIEISGFSEAELLGQSHNIVRHPDMPVEAFADLWKTVKGGTSWNGIVKNRCKNGDYYWVDANVTPMRESGQMVGFVSVRRKPTQKQIAAAEALYALLKAGKNPNAGLQGMLNKLRNISIKQRIVGTLVLAAMLMLFLGGYGLYQIQQANVRLDELGNHKAKSVYQMEQINVLMLENLRQLQSAASYDPRLAESRLHEHPISRNFDAVARNNEAIDAIAKEIGAESHDAESEQLIAGFLKARDVFSAEGLRPAAELMRAGRFAEANAFMTQTTDKLFEAADQRGKVVVSSLQASMVNDVVMADEAYQASRNLFAMILLGGVAIIGAFGLLLYRAVVPPIQRLAIQIEHAAHGEPDQKEEENPRRDEVNAVFLAFRALSTRMGFDVAESKRLSDENLRIKIALDNVSTGCMIADNERTSSM